MMTTQPSISIVGIGPWEWEHLTLLAAERLSEPVPIFCNYAADYHPVVNKLTQEGRMNSLYHLYELAEIPHHQKYAIFAEVVIQAAREFGRAIWAVTGNAFVYDLPSALIARRCEEEGFKLEVVPGISSIEAIYGELRIDPGDGLQLLNADQFHEGTVLHTDIASLVLQVLWTATSVISKTLARHYPAEHPVTIVDSAGYKGQGRHTRCTVGEFEPTLRQLEASGVNQSLVTMYLPALASGDGEPARQEKVYGRTAHQVVEYPLLEGGIMVVPVGQFSTAQDIEDIQVILVEPAYIKLWSLLEQGGSVAHLLEELGDLVQSEEQLRHMLTRFFDHGLIDEP